MHNLIKCHKVLWTLNIYLIRALEALLNTEEKNSNILCHKTWYFMRKHDFKNNLSHLASRFSVWLTIKSCKLATAHESYFFCFVTLCIIHTDVRNGKLTRILKLLQYIWFFFFIYYTIFYIVILYPSLVDISHTHAAQTYLNLNKIKNEK